MMTRLTYGTQLDNTVGRMNRSLRHQPHWQPLSLTMENAFQSCVLVGHLSMKAKNDLGDKKACQ